jgi:hypothetical protein
VEEGEIGEDADAAVEEAAEGSGENLTRVKADLCDLVKAQTCFIGKSLTTQADLDALRLEGCFEPGICQLPGKETTPKPQKNKSMVFRDFFTAGLRLPVSKKFEDISATYNVQIHQLMPNSIPQVLKFLWAYRTFAGDNDVETFVRHFKIHWARKLITIYDEEKEAQYGYCTFQTRPGKNQAPVELAPAYKNKWANRWTSYWVYAPIAVVGRNSKQEEVTSFDLASRMVDLDVELSPELTKASRSSASTCAFYQVTSVITTRDALEEFVSTDIWPCQPRWGSWAFKVQWLPGLDQNVQSPIFNVKRPAHKTDEEVVAEVERKVVQMIGNFTHKEWECAQRILKHQGRVNRVFDEMGVTYSPRSVPSTASKKMQQPSNIGSEHVETSWKSKSSKTAVTTENVVKNTKAQDILANRKADAAKATLPPLAEKSTKLLKVNETLARRKAEAAKVAAAEREKKKVHDPSPAADTDKKMASKKRPSEATERGKSVMIKEKGPDDDEPSGKRARADPVTETDDDVDILSTPWIQPCTNYPPKGSARKVTEEPSTAGLADPEELEAREVRGKHMAEMIQKKIAMAGAAPKERVAGLVDVVDESEDLCYIDDDATLAAKDSEVPTLQPQSNPEGAAMNPGESLGLRAQNPIDLDAPKIEESAAHSSRSPPPVSDDLYQAAAKAANETTPVPVMTSNVLQLEDAGMILLLKDSFSCPSYRTCVPFADVFRFCVDFSGQDFGQLEHQGHGERGSAT